MDPLPSYSETVVHKSLELALIILKCLYETICHYSSMAAAAVILRIADTGLLIQALIQDI